MKTVNELENSITGLSAEDYKKFRDWFWEYEHQTWDAKLEADIKNNKLDALANAALQDFKDGKYSTLWFIMHRLLFGSVIIIYQKQYKTWLIKIICF